MISKSDSGDQILRTPPSIANTRISGSHNTKATVTECQPNRIFFYFLFVKFVNHSFIHTVKIIDCWNRWSLPPTSIMNGSFDVVNLYCITSEQINCFFFLMKQQILCVYDWSTIIFFVNKFISIEKFTFHSFISWFSCSVSKLNKRFIIHFLPITIFRFFVTLQTNETLLSIKFNTLAVSELIEIEK